MTTFPQGTPQPLPRKPSGGVVALGVINIVYSIFFYICCGFASFASPAFTKALQKVMEQQGVSGYAPTRAMQAISMVNGFVFIVLGTLLIIGGIGLLRRAPWGRMLSLWSAAAVIAWVLIAFAIQIFFLYPQVTRMTGSQFPRQQMVVNVIFGVVGVFFQLVYPVVLIICLNLNSIRNQFEEADHF